METLSLYYTDKYISRIASPTAHYRFCPRLSPKSPVLQIADALISTLALYQIYRRLKNQFYFKKAIIAVDRYLQVEEEICARHKGTCHLRFSGIRPLRGGRGYPPFPLRKKTFFFSHWFSVKGGEGVPPNSAKEKNLLFRSKNSIFCLILCIFSPFWTIIWPFWPIFNLNRKSVWKKEGFFP